MRGSVGYDRATRRWWYRHDGPSAEKRRQIRKRGFRTRKDAEEALAVSLWETRQAGTPPPGYTLAAWLERTIDGRVHHLAPTTLQRYRNTLDAWIKPTALGRITLARLDADAVRGWQDELRTRGLAASTIGAAWRVVLTHLGPLVAAGSVPAEVARVAPPRSPPNPLRVWTPEQTHTALTALRGDLLHPLVVVAVTTGLRAGELLALEWSDLQGGALVVQRSVGWVHGRALVKEPKTGWARRVELYPEAILAIEEQRERSRHRAQVLHYDPEPLIFPRSSDRGYWRPQNLSSQWQKRLQRIPVPRIRWHDLRHTHASHLLAARVSVPAVAARLGHTVATLQRTYAHLIPGQQAEAVRLGAAYLRQKEPCAQMCPEQPGKAGE